MGKLLQPKSCLNMIINFMLIKDKKISRIIHFKFLIFCNGLVQMKIPANLMFFKKE